MEWIKLKDIDGSDYLLNISNISLIHKDSNTILVNAVTPNGDGHIRVDGESMDKLLNALYANSKRKLR